MRFIYTVWFRDPAFPPDDQDYEWPACFVVDAVGAAEARSWGDRLASAYAWRSKQETLSSSTEPLASTDLLGVDPLPVVEYGVWASDEEIGW